MRRRAALGLLVVATAVGLAACTPPAAPQGQPSIAPTDVPSSPAPELSPTPEATSGPPTCNAIIPASTVADFTSLGWTVQIEPFRIASMEISGGVQCKWGDQKVTTDRVQLFGWAPISAADAAEAQRELVASGWKSEQAADGVYVTENPDWAIAKDANGYGMTYLFGDGWVKLADTRQSLVLVDWPPA